MIKNLNQRKKKTECRFDESFSRAAWLCRGQDVDSWWSRKKTVSAFQLGIHCRSAEGFPFCTSLCHLSVPNRTMNNYHAAEDQQFPDASFLHFGCDRSHTRRHVFLALSEVSFVPFVQVQGSDFEESTHGCASTVWEPGETQPNLTWQEVISERLFGFWATIAPHSALHTARQMKAKTGSTAHLTMGFFCV